MPLIAMKNTIGTDVHPPYIFLPVQACFEIGDKKGSGRMVERQIAISSGSGSAEHPIWHEAPSDGEASWPAGCFLLPGRDRPAALYCKRRCCGTTIKPAAPWGRRFYRCSPPPAGGGPRRSGRALGEVFLTSPGRRPGGGAGLPAQAVSAGPGQRGAFSFLRTGSQTSKTAFAGSGER